MNSAFVDEGKLIMRVHCLYTVSLNMTLSVIFIGFANCSRVKV